jgi:hypothetical protein
MHRGSSLVVLVILAVGAGCARGRPALASHPAAPVADSTVHLNVTNNYVQAVEVYASNSSTNYRVGTVLPGLQNHFTLTPAMLASGGNIEFTAVPADFARPAHSGRLLLKPGDVVDFVIADHLVGSAATVRP